jgi:hypothetical protein
MDKNRPPPRPGIADFHGTTKKSGNRSKRNLLNDPNSNTNSNTNTYTGNANANGPHQGGTTKRQQFSNRTRTLSSGSTRGAFGPITVKDAQKQHDEIYRVQNAAMTRNYRNINKNDRNLNLPPVEVVTENLRDEETGGGNGNGGTHGNNGNNGNNGNGNGHPLYRQHKEQPSSQHQSRNAHKHQNPHERVPSTDSNTRFMFSHHSPTLEDLQLQAQKDREIQMFASMATNTDDHQANNMTDKYAHYGSNNNNLNHSWDDHPGNITNNDTFSYEDQSYNDNGNGNGNDDENESQEEPSFFRDLYHQLVHDPNKPEFSSLQGCRCECACVCVCN